MTKFVRVVMLDNLDLAEDPPRCTDAIRTHVLQLDGKAVEIDLNEEHSLELLAFLKRYFDAGDAPGQEPAQDGQPGSSAHKGRKFTPGVVQRNRDMRAWADREGVRNPKHPDLPAYLSPAGTYKHPLWLVKMYEQHLAEQPAAQAGGMLAGARSLARVSLPHHAVSGRTVLRR